MMKLIVELNGASTPIHIDGENVEYTEAAIQIDLLQTLLASLVRN